MSSLDKYIKELKNNPRFKDYDITTDNYNNFLLMSIEDKSVGEKNPIKGYYHKAFKNNKGGYDFLLCPCDETKIKLNKVSKSEHLDTTFSTDGYLDATLKDFRETTEARIKAKNYAYKFIKEYDRQNFMKGLFLHGTYGSGKTYLLSALSNELCKNGFDVSIVFFPDLCRELKRTMFKDDSSDVINRLKNVDILVLDDLGAENLTGYIRDDVLGPILNYRWSMKKPFFIASNLNVGGLISHLSQTKEDMYNKSVDDIKAARIMERIRQSTIECEFKD